MTVNNHRKMKMFFESLPLSFNWNSIANLNQLTKKEQDQREREKKQLNQKAKEGFSSKMKTLEIKESAEEKKLKNEKYHRFLTTDCWMKKEGKKKMLNVRNCFFRADNGKVQIYGRDKKNTREFKMQGTVRKNGECEFQLIYQDSKDHIEIKGAFGIKETVFFFKGTFVGGKIRISLDVDYWFGYYETEDDPNDMPAFFKSVDSNYTGISLDKEGLAIWNGSKISNEWKMNKQYIGDSPIEFIGRVQEKRNGCSINGRWKKSNVAEDNEGDFYLCQNVEDFYANSQESGESSEWHSDINEENKDEREEENEDVKESENDHSGDFLTCSNEHPLLWKANLYPDTTTYFCDNCNRDFLGESARWNCTECDYDLSYMSKNPRRIQSKMQERSFVGLG